MGLDNLEMSALVLFSCHGKHQDQKQLMRGKSLLGFYFKVTVLSSKEVRAEIQAGTLNRNHEDLCLLTSSSPGFLAQA